MLGAQVHGDVPVTAHLGSVTEVVVVEGRSAVQTDDADVLRTRNTKYHCNYTVVATSIVGRPTSVNLRRSTPPIVDLMGFANTAVKKILRSPAHPMLSGSTVLIRYTGNRTGKKYALPVQYADAHHGLVVLVGEAENKTWWRNFADMGQLQVLLKGAWVPMTAHALRGDDEPDAVTPLLRSYAAVPQGGEVARRRHVRGTGQPRRGGVAPAGHELTRSREHVRSESPSGRPSGCRTTSNDSWPRW